MNFRNMLFWVPLLWVASEIALVLVKRSKPADSRSDMSSIRVLWITIATSVTAGVLIGIRSFGHMYRPARVLAFIGLALMICGLAVRWVAIFSLKRSFTVDVAVSEGQTIIKSGIYRRVRHPAYSGSLLSFLGLGLCFSNWLSLLVIMIPISMAFLHRIRIEEEALSLAFGREYSDYCASTKRLIPGVY
jgi:protein-S-isoprenylcysteine O-methyltransferase Ste14